MLLIGPQIVCRATAQSFWIFEPYCRNSLEKEKLMRSRQLALAGRIFKNSEEASLPPSNQRQCLESGE
jgi:hypothetical protein